jgi:hypothetical protein
VRLLRTTEELKLLATKLHDLDGFGGLSDDPWYEEGWPDILDSYTELPFNGIRRSYLKTVRDMLMIVPDWRTVGNLIYLTHCIHPRHKTTRLASEKYSWEFSGVVPDEKTKDVWRFVHERTCGWHHKEPCTMFYTREPDVIKPRRYGGLEEEIAVAAKMLELEPDPEKIKKIARLATEWTHLRNAGRS